MNQSNSKSVSNSFFLGKACFERTGGRKNFFLSCFEELYIIKKGGIDGGTFRSCRCECVAFI